MPSLLEAERRLDVSFTGRWQLRAVTTRAHHVQVALDCECGATVEACDEEEPFDELLEHIAAAHEDGGRVEPAAMLTAAYEA